MVEQGGTKLSAILCKADPWAGATCGRTNCFPCDSSGEGQGGGCLKENVLYKLTCTTCRKEDTCAEYVGESSRSLFQRMAEHIGGAKRKDPRNPLFSHIQAYHPGLQAEPSSTFTVKLLRTFRTPLARVIAEAVGIDSSEADIIINSKSEWGSTRIPRLTIEVGEKVRQEDHRGRNQGVRRLHQHPWGSTTSHQAVTPPPQEPGVQGVRLHQGTPHPNNPRDSPPLRRRGG